MNPSHCTKGFDQLCSEIGTKLSKVSDSLEKCIVTLEQNDIGILNDIDGIAKELFDLESKTSTYFINSLLAEYTENSTEISRAVHKLSLKKQGALIAIEKNDPVSPFVTGGIAMNARITSQLLESIFNPESPLHRGAVLIRKDMILSASNQLPYSGQIFWDRIFDPREQSALGLAERCDALILLISDNGTTSFCLEGTLYPFSAT